MSNRNRIIGAAIGLIAIGFSVSFAQEINQNKVEGGQEAPRAFVKNAPITTTECGQEAAQRTKKPGKFDGAAFTLNCGGNGVSSNEDEKNRQEREREDLIAQQSVAEATWVIVRFTFLQFMLSAAGLWALLKSLSLSQKATAAAINAIDVARDAIGIERAWVTFFDVVPETHAALTTGDGVTHQSGIMMYIRWKNSGRSPAIKCIMYGEGRLIGIKEEIPTIVPMPNADVSHGLIIAQNQTSGAIPLTIVGADFDRFINREIMAVYSKVTYIDVYKPEITRESECCVSVSYRGQILGPNGGRNFTYDIYPRGPQNTAT